MKDRPILFSAPMVRALLDGTKTQTRRVVKPQPITCEAGTELLSISNGLAKFGSGDVITRKALCPYGQPGDRIWVRETWQKAGGGSGYWYRSTDSEADDGWPPVSQWRPSIYMPRHASRITLEITGVRVERLQDISEADCWAEGISEIREKGDEHGDLSGSVTHDYRALWESINGPGSWDENPWVWVVEFKRVTS